MKKIAAQKKLQIGAWEPFGSYKIDSKMARNRDFLVENWRKQWKTGANQRFRGGKNCENHEREFFFSTKLVQTSRKPANDNHILKNVQNTV